MEAVYKMAKIAYSSIGFKDSDIYAALDGVAAAGFDQVEILCQEPHVVVVPKGAELADFIRRLESLHLGTSIHAPLKKNVLGAPDEQWRREVVGVMAEHLHFAAAIGAREMIIHPIPNPIFIPQPNDDPSLPGLMTDAVRASLDDLIPISQQTKVRMLLENLPYECNYPLLTMAKLRPFIEQYPVENVGLVIDTGHAAISGDDPGQAIRTAGDRLCSTHLQDVSSDRSYDNHWIPTHGTLDWDSIRQAFADINYPGVWTFEVINARHDESDEELARLTRQIASDWGLL